MSVIAKWLPGESTYSAHRLWKFGRMTVWNLTWSATVAYTKLYKSKVNVEEHIKIVAFNILLIAFILYCMYSDLFIAIFYLCNNMTVAVL